MPVCTDTTPLQQPKEITEYKTLRKPIILVSQSCRDYHVMISWIISSTTQTRIWETTGTAGFPNTPIAQEITPWITTVLIHRILGITRFPVMPLLPLPRKKQRYKLQDSVFISQVSSAVAVIRKRSLGHNIAVRTGSSSATRGSHSLLQLGEGREGHLPIVRKYLGRIMPFLTLCCITLIHSFQIINANWKLCVVRQLW